MTQATYIDDRALAARYAVSRATVWRWVKTERLPKPIRLSPGCTRWRLSEVEDWERQQEAQRSVACG